MARKYNRTNFNGKKKKYTRAERIAFNMGQEARVRKSLNNTDSRVYEAYCKGLQGRYTGTKKKSLYGE